MAIFIATAPPASAEKDVLVQCLEAPFYPDGSELYVLCNKALEADDLSDDTRAAIDLQLGQALYFAHRPELALSPLNEAIRLDPKSDQAFRRRGWSYVMLGYHTQAISDFTDYLALSPDDPDAQFGLAFAQRNAGGRCDRAMRDYERILADHPDHYITRYNLADAYYCVDGHQIRQLEEYSKLIAAGRGAIAGVTYYSRAGAEDYDFYALVLEARAEVLMNTGRYDDAQADYDWLTGNYPTKIAPRVNRSSANYHRGDVMAALDDAEAALKLDPDFPPAQKAKLTVLQSLHRFDEMLDYASDVLNRGHTSEEAPFFHIYRGQALKQLGYRQEAIKDINQAMAGNDMLVWSVHTQLQQSGYLFGPEQMYGRDPLPDFRAAPFANALEACMIDPECF